MMSASAGHSGDDGACNCGRPHRRDAQHGGELSGACRRTPSAPAADGGQGQRHGDRQRGARRRHRGAGLLSAAAPLAMATRLSIRELRAALDAAGIDSTGCRRRELEHLHKIAAFTRLLIFGDSWARADRSRRGQRWSGGARLEHAQPRDAGQRQPDLRQRASRSRRGCSAGRQRARGRVGDRPHRRQRHPALVRPRAHRLRRVGRRARTCPCACCCRSRRWGSSPPTSPTCWRLRPPRRQNFVLVGLPLAPQMPLLARMTEQLLGEGACVSASAASCCGGWRRSATARAACSAPSSASAAPTARRRRGSSSTSARHRRGARRRGHQRADRFWFDGLHPSPEGHRALAAHLVRCSGRARAAREGGRPRARRDANAPGPRRRAAAVLGWPGYRCQSAKHARRAARRAPADAPLRVSRRRLELGLRLKRGSRRRSAFPWRIPPWRMAAAPCSTRTRTSA